LSHESSLARDLFRQSDSPTPAEREVISGQANDLGLAAGASDHGSLAVDKTAAVVHYHGCEARPDSMGPARFKPELGGVTLVVAITGNHEVLMWHRPACDVDDPTITAFGAINSPLVVYRAS
jgi:hypothetical protein